MIRSSKFHALALSIPILLSTYSSADSFSFTGTAFTGDDQNNINLSGASMNLYSAAPGGFAGVLFTCTLGMTCQVPSLTISTFDSPTGNPGLFSGGTFNGLTADTLGGGLVFSGTSFVLSSDENSPGSGPVSFSGEVGGAMFSPVGCETTPTSPTCQFIQLFAFHVKGTGIITLSGELAGDNGLFDVLAASYTFSGTTAVVPEPSTLLMFVAGIPAVLGTRWRYRTR